MTKRYLVISLFVAAIAALILHFMGRSFFCECGSISLWSGDVTSGTQSQQFTDPYSFTHVIHGIIFYFLLWAIFRKKLTPTQRFLIALGIEGLWEIVENTSYIIDKYRLANSPNYYGDSIFNSLGDLVAMSLGFFASWKFPKKVTVFILIGIELALLYFIHDNLTLNIVNLIYPVEALKEWQIRM
jgi:hypothetical protein